MSDIIKQSPLLEATVIIGVPTVSALHCKLITHKKDSFSLAETNLIRFDKTSVRLKKKITFMSLFIKVKNRDKFTRVNYHGNTTP